MTIFELGKFKSNSYLLIYWVLGLCLALFIPQSFANVIDSNFSRTHVPLLDSISAASINKAIWETYFITMSLALMSILPLLFGAVKREIKPPNVRNPAPVAIVMVIAGLIILFWLLNITFDNSRISEASAGSKVLFFRSLVNSRVGLALVGSSLMTGLLVLIMGCFIIPLCAMLKNISK